MSPRNGDSRSNAPRDAKGGSRRRSFRALLVAGYAIAGVVQVAVAARSKQVVDIPLSAQFGLFQLLPPTYWVGMGLIGFAMVSRSLEDESVFFLSPAYPETPVRHTATTEQDVKRSFTFIGPPLGQRLGNFFNFKVIVPPRQGRDVSGKDRVSTHNVKKRHAERVFRFIILR